MRKGATGQVKVYSIVGLTSRANHYVYRLDDPDTGQFYIGVRSCLGAPEEDSGYMGSGKWCNAHPAISRVKKTIVRTFETREEAAAFEVAEIRRNNNDPLCANKQFRVRNSSAFDIKESRFSHQRVPFSGHGTVIEPSKEPDNIQAPKPIAPDGAPLAPEKKAPIKGKLQLRAEALFRRPADKPLDASEARALKGAKQAILSTTEEDWLFLERFYAAPQAETYARKGFAQLLNNWNGEITKAREWCKSRGISFGQPSAAVRPEDVEPDGWREYLAKTYPDHNLHAGAWRSISRANRIDFIREIAASKSK